jgi:hypothetical protein
MLIYKSLPQIWQGINTKARSAGKDLCRIFLAVVVLRIETFIRDNGRCIAGKRL